MDMRKLVGENFARLRKERGLTQEQVEERSGFSQWYISSLERGRRNPTIISLYELANAIGVRVSDLIADHPEITAPTDPADREPRTGADGDE
ncbi:helix-turn-helix domain-containing protein [Bosea beijingensis]|jgi:transcriptional regulator with XRE-family HTH domain